MTACAVCEADDGHECLPLFDAPDTATEPCGCDITPTTGHHCPPPF